MERPRLTVRSVGYPEQVISKEVRKQRAGDKVSKEMTNMVSK